MSESIGVLHFTKEVPSIKSVQRHKSVAPIFEILGHNVLKYSDVGLQQRAWCTQNKLNIKIESAEVSAIATSLRNRYLIA